MTDNKRFSFSDITGNIKKSLSDAADQKITAFAKAVLKEANIEKEGDNYRLTMPNGTTYVLNYQDLLKEINKTLDEMGGNAVSQLYNTVTDEEIEYVGDGQWQPKTKKKAEHTFTVADRLLIAMINDIESTGGIVAFTDGLHAPVADEEWVDLGERIMEMYSYLKETGHHVTLTVKNVAYSSKEA